MRTNREVAEAMGVHLVGSERTHTDPLADVKPDGLRIRAFRQLRDLLSEAVNARDGELVRAIRIQAAASGVLNQFDPDEFYLAPLRAVATRPVASVAPAPPLPTRAPSQSRTNPFVTKMNAISASLRASVDSFRERASTQPIPTKAPPMAQQSDPAPKTRGMTSAEIKGLLARNKIISEGLAKVLESNVVDGKQREEFVREKREIDEQISSLQIALVGTLEAEKLAEQLRDKEQDAANKPIDPQQAKVLARVFGGARPMPERSPSPNVQYELNVTRDQAVAWVDAHRAAGGYR
jgi:hypothetical protein